MPLPLETFQARGFRFACSIVRLYSRLTNVPDLPPHLARQVLHAGTSVGANLEEAKGGHSRKDAAAKFSIALKESRETSYWLRLLLATELVSPTLVAPAIEEAQELIAILTVARRKLNTPAPEGNSVPAD